MTRGPGPRSLFGRRCRLRPVAGPSPCAELVRVPGPDPRKGAGSARLPGRPSAGVAALGLGSAGAAAALCLPCEEAVAWPPRSRRRESASLRGTGRSRVLAYLCPGSELRVRPTRQNLAAAGRGPEPYPDPPALSRPTPESRSDSRSLPCRRAEMSDLERFLCERTGYIQKSW